MNKFKLNSYLRYSIIISAVALLIVFVSVFAYRSSEKSMPTLTLYCAAGLKQPVEAVVKSYEDEMGVKIQIQYGGSGVLLSNIRASGLGDIYLAADHSYIEKARDFGLIEEVFPVAQQNPVILTSPANGHQISKLSDLWEKKLKIGLGNPETTSIGRSVQSYFQSIGAWDKLSSQVVVYKPTVNDSANDVKIGAVDASIIWDSTAIQYPELTAISLSEFNNLTEQVSLAVLKSSSAPTEALKFARYLTAPERGNKIMEKSFSKILPGDKWELNPELLFYCGSMLRPGIQETLKEFENREGCRVNSIYNGCGILTAQMKTGQKPDVYFSCDTTFMSTVAERFDAPTDIVQNRLGILTAKNNPLNILTLNDLLRPGLRLGLPHSEKSAMGAVIKNLLIDNGIYSKLGENLKLESPTGDFLVNQLRTGSLDAILACYSNFITSKDHLDYIPIEHPLATMTQPIAIGNASQNRLLSSRLKKAILTLESKNRFEQAGFQWKAP